MLRAKLQEEGLRTYLLAYGRFYSSLSIAPLCDMFELPERKVSRSCGEWAGWVQGRVFGWSVPRLVLPVSITPPPPPPFPPARCMLW